MMKIFGAPLSSFLAAFLVLLAGLFAPYAVFAQEQEFSQEFAQEEEGHFVDIHDDYQATWRGKVIDILSQERRTVPGTDLEHVYQTIRAEILEGPKKGEVVTIENDYLVLQKGDRFFMNHLVDVGGVERYIVLNVDRRTPLFALVALFFLVVIVFSGWQGVRALFALAGSFVVLFYILIPGLLNGWDPILASFLVSAGILFFAIFFTHGFHRESLVAYGGTMIAVGFTAVFAMIAVGMTSLSGLAGDEAVYLNFTTRGTLDFTALLLGAIIIGVLGVLDDIAITQAAMISELYGSNPNMSKMEAYRRAMRVGREHVSSLVNTLVLAYTGASLPLLLLFYNSPAGFTSILNMEIFATEIVRMIVGSIGLIMTVPIVTILAVFALKGYVPSGAHSHSHSHTHGHLTSRGEVNTQKETT